MQYDFGTLPSSCQLKNAEDTRLRTSSHVNDSPHRKKKRWRGVNHDLGSSPVKSKGQEDDLDAVTWANSSSPMAMGEENQAAPATSPLSLTHLRDRSKSIYSATNDPATELRSKFIASEQANNRHNSGLGSSSRSGKKKVGKLMSLPASRLSGGNTGNSDMGSTIASILDNLEDDKDAKNNRAKSLPSSPRQLSESENDNQNDEDDDDLDWDELEKEIQHRATQSETTPEQENQKDNVLDADQSSDISDIDLDQLDQALAETKSKDTTPKNEKGSNDIDIDLDIDLDKLEQEVFSKQTSEHAAFRKESTNKIRDQEKETLDCEIKRTDFLRMMVLEVEMDIYTLHGRPQDQIVVKAHHNKHGTKIIYLRGEWTRACPVPDDVVHVIGGFNHSEREIVVDMGQNYFIIHPDYLVTATNVADSFYCQRKIVLRDRIRQPGGSVLVKEMLYGDLVHRLFEVCLKEHNFKREFMEKWIREVVEQEYFEAIIMLDMTLDELLLGMAENIGKLIQFRNRFLQKKPHVMSKVHEHRMNRDGKASVSGIVDVEEEIWSPLFGLQGRIDATVQSTVKDDDGTLHTHLVPLELKTAKSHRTIGHRAQTSLYTLMMSDRYQIDISFGLLYYSETFDMHKIPNFHDEVASLLAQRNYLAQFMKTRQGLPEPLVEDMRCDKCNQQAECMVYHKTAEQGGAETAGHGPMFEENTDHLTQHHVEFFNHWDKLMDKESMEGAKFRKEIWTMDSKTREGVGRCFGNLQIKPMHDGAKDTGERWSVYVLERVANDNRRINSTDSQLVPSDRIVVSDETGHFCLATGFIRSINSREIEISVDRRLENSMKLQDGYTEQNQLYMPRLNNSTMTSKHNGISVFRIDQDPFEKSMAMARGNMMQLFVKPGCPILREMVIDLNEPKFLPEAPEYDLDFSKHNSNQLKAVDLVMRAQNYALILGMPGTGKTTTIASLIESLVKAGKTILLTSYTHSAVDNICLKIRNRGFDICRLASSTNRVHPQCHDLVPQIREGDELTKEATERKYFGPPVVATTCLSINHWLFGVRQFDYCIVDEASQLTLPVCVGPLRLADKFVLVGDHFQLQPMVKNTEAARDGLKQSLFERLSNAHPQASVNLAQQYRMCEDIMLVSNELVYDNRLTCGSKEVAEQSLKVPKPELLDQMKQRQGDDWLGFVVKESTRVVFLNTDNVEDAEEKAAGGLIQNVCEAEILYQLVEGLCACGVEESSLGLITPYKAQLKLIQHLMRGRQQVESLTADRFQGRDKDCIIISLVRNNKEGNIGELLNDWRRLNVTFTRAKSKLVMVGSRRTLERDPRLETFLKLVDRQNWGYDLSMNCRQMYDLPTPVFISPSKSQRHTQQRVGHPESPTAKRVLTPKKFVPGARVMEQNSVVRDITNDLKAPENGEWVPRSTAG